MARVNDGNSNNMKKYPAPLTVADIEACPDRATFLQLVMPYYQAACKEFGIRWPGVCALQCIHETGVPTKIAPSLRQNNNMGGLKGGKGIPGSTGPGTVSTEGDRYAAFPSVDKYIYAAIWNIKESGYYGDALAATTMEDFANKLCHTWVMGEPWGKGNAYGGPYDTKYAPDIIAEYQQYGLASYENDGSGSVTGATGAVSGSPANSSTDLSNANAGKIAGKTFDSSVRERTTARTIDGSHPELKTFYRVNMTAAQFIRQVLAPYCRSKATGQGAYRLWFDDETFPDGSPGVKLYFKPDQYNQIEDRTSDKILEDIDKTYQFTFGSGHQSSVIEFNPNYAGIVTSVTGGYEVDAATTEAITNDMISVGYNKYTDKVRPSTGDSVYDDLRGRVTIGDSSHSMEDIANRAANLWYNMSSYGYTAEMTVLGDPMIETQKLCSVAVYTPYGLPHHSSGVYLIHHVNDTISGGSYLTTLSLVRNAINIGTDDSGGIDITVGDKDTVYVGEAATMAGQASTSSASGSSTTASGALSGTDDNSDSGSSNDSNISSSLTGDGPQGVYSDSDYSDTVFIGDSLMATRRAQLSMSFPGVTVKAQSGAPFSTLINFATSIENGKNPNRVVVGMGNNDWKGISVAQANQIINILNGKGTKDIYLIKMLVTNNKQSTTNTNHAIDVVAGNNKNVHIIDWNAAISGDTKKYLQDNVHQSNDGFNLYVDLIRKAL